MHRIPGSAASPERPGKTVTYLQHGLLDSSATWVVMRKQQSLGYMLADLGYDVWLGNKRGNRYSRQHIRDDPDGRRGDRRRFWDFSWHHVCYCMSTNFIRFLLKINHFTDRNR